MLCFLPVTFQFYSEQVPSLHLLQSEMFSLPLEVSAPNLPQPGAVESWGRDLEIQPLLLRPLPSE